MTMAASPQLHLFQNIVHLLIFLGLGLVISDLQDKDNDRMFRTSYNPTIRTYLHPELEAR
jgi:hypothetical protein